MKLHRGLFSTYSAGNHGNNDSSRYAIPRVGDIFCAFPMVLCAERSEIYAKIDKSLISIGQLDDLGYHKTLKDLEGMCDHFERCKL